MKKWTKNGNLITNKINKNKQKGQVSDKKTALFQGFCKDFVLRITLDIIN